jgi:restriction system protein
MDAKDAKSAILNQVYEISPTQFEQLCKILIRRSERTRELGLTPKAGDDGIDVHAVVDRDLFQARLGVQAKLNNEENKISSGAIRRFKGSLGEQEYSVGTFITSSSFTKPARQSANKGYIRTIDGEKLAEIMVQSQLGVVKEGDEYELDWGFWDIFNVSEEGDLIRSDEIPQADTVETLNIVLQAIEQGNDVKPTITEFMERKTGESWDPRQADYYAHAAWPLGFVHKDMMKEYEGYERRQWGLTAEGQEYVNYLYDGKKKRADELLFERIREMEIARRILDVLEKEGKIPHKQLQKIVQGNTLPEGDKHGLSENTANRRGNTIGRWIEKLPEVSRLGNTLADSVYIYRQGDLSDYSD